MHLKPKLKVYFNSDLKNPVKTTPILQVYLWSLGGQGNLDMEYGMWGVI